MSAFNSVSYTGDDSTTDFAVTFDYLRQSDLTVYVDGVDTDFTMNGSDVVIDPAPTAGQDVQIIRTTVLSTAYSTFVDDSAWTAANLNGAVLQALYGAQDAHIRIDALGEGEGTGTGADVPVPAAADRMLLTVFTGSAYEYQLKTVAQMQTLLGISTPVTVPTPTSGNKFVITNVSTNDYELQTVAQIKTLLGVPTLNLPTVNGRQNNILMTKSDASGVEWRDAAQVRSALTLGTAALLNTGTAVGNVVQLVTHANGPALPAVRADNLLGIAIDPDYTMWEQTTNVVIATADGWKQCFASAAESVAGDSTSWYRSVSNGVQVDTGTYHIKAEFQATSGGVGGTVSYRISASGTVSPTVIATLGFISAEYQTVETWFRVTGATSDITLQGDSATATCTVDAVRLHITKVA